mgnify:CR=1 FL=1
MANINTVKARFGIIGHNSRLNSAIEIAIQVAPTDVTVLIVGENGTGKDVFSKIIHQFGRRKHQNLISINTGAIPEGTMDSELFGHEKGSFTGAIDNRKGYFEEVDGGTIFLDEIGEMPMATQARMLRLLENHEYLRVGSSKVRTSDVRVITATNKNLIEQIRKGKFREDLYFRLNTITINVPPLRDRGTDILDLFNYFAEEFATEYRREQLSLTPDATEMLYQYRWPGNVRELKNFVQRLSVLVPEPIVTSEIVREHLNIRESYLPTIANQDSSIADEASNQRREIEMLYKLLLDMREEVNDIKQAISSGQTPKIDSFPDDRRRGDIIIEDGRSDSSNRMRFNREQPSSITIEHQGNENATRVLEQPLNLELNEKELIIRSLQKHGNNRKKAAQELGISERTLYRKINQYEIG